MCGWMEHGKAPSAKLGWVVPQNPSFQPLLLVLLPLALIVARNDPTSWLDVTPTVGWESVAAPSLSHAPQILEKNKWVLMHLGYLQIKGAVVNYRHPFPGAGELWGLGNTSNQEKWFERHQLLNLPLVLPNNYHQKPGKVCGQHIKLNRLSLKD